MNTILAIAKKHGLFVIEDAAQAIMSSYDGKPLGTFGQLGTLSFHETKNVISGEGGALLINDPKMIERAEILREKGTNRSQFSRRQVDKYRWVDVGSSFLPGEIIAAFLLAQLHDAENITAKRKVLWENYHHGLEELEINGLLRRPFIPELCTHNAHCYYIILESEAVRSNMIAWLQQHNINSVFHYVPLHSSPAGLQYSRTHGSMKYTDDLSSRLLRLPMWIGLEEQQNRVINAVKAFFS
jgi:dTDP-4-amino-4,6-dideoxygalactose transaminase